ncbi:hypothetical protein D9V37_06865 [Nocardioides mangrovicus]|uniref:Uncharacterized protein n=1 Tax=Nocardioides mangrovicus TaxID=2478913 RepID=A0A3L8P2V1_9ACTN|nr:hypothetical protein [Nocardioides mangrovicus]RLV49635.1 hypothetical protein D9V37_06865 [Nocardioides mangrovicus]
MSDPRSIDPEQAETDEVDVAEQDGSSSAPEQDPGDSGSEAADREALREMPEGTAEEQDQVGEGE